MAITKISVINESTVVADNDVPAVIDALQKQVHEHFAPAWGVDADLSFVPSGGTPVSGSWWLVILDDADQAGALGYHDLTSEGLPIGKVFAKTDLQYQQLWSVTASHELLEMLGDPDINLTLFDQKDANSGILYAYEVCDACEDDSFGYKIGNVTVSDFVFPAYFETFRTPGSTQFDYGKKLNAPIPALLKGGYLSTYNVNSGSGWQQITAQEATVPYRNRPHLGSRRERRRTPRNQWVKSKLVARKARGSK